jgi:hypothetical protein
MKEGTYRDEPVHYRDDEYEEMKEGALHDEPIQYQDDNKKNGNDIII